jgi:hypothetical protein
MSWSARYTYGAEGKIEFSGDPLKSEIADQFDLAVSSVNDIISRGVLGSPAGEYNVVISGHANPKHEPVAGWANDCLTISITQV